MFTQPPRVSAGKFARLVASCVAACTFSIQNAPCMTMTTTNALSAEAVSQRIALLETLKQKGVANEYLQSMKESAGKFEARMTDSHEVEQTYSEVNHLLAVTDSNHTNADERLQLVSQILAQAASPTSINQGRHNTCAIAALEARTYTIHPGTAAAVVEQIATTGQLVTADGATVKLKAENVHPDGEAQVTGYGGRSYASQLFQIAIANVYWQTRDKDPRGLDCGKGTIRYIEKEPINGFESDTGERIQINWPDGVTETVVDDGGRPVCEPCFSLSAVQQVAALLSPDCHDGTFVIAGNRFDSKQRYVPVRSAADLRKKLSMLKEQSKLPLVAAVDCAKGWLAEEPQAQILGNGWYTFTADTGKHTLTSVQNSGMHAVCITDFDANSDTVSIDNFWGYKSDHIGSNAVPVSSLYEAIASNQR